MILWIRTRATFANVTATLALVFAMSGGAYAANHYIIDSLKQINPKVAKTLKGKRGPRGPVGATGPAGPTGLQGLAGTAGKDGLPGKEGKEGVPGKDGKDGAPGKDGESVTSTSLSQGDTHCAEGGSGFTVGGKETYACNGPEGKEGQAGKDGQPWTPNNVLPSGASEKGTWVAEGRPVPLTLFGNELEMVEGSFSFPIPLSETLGEEATHIIALGHGEGETEEELPEEEVNGQKIKVCKGNVSNPQAVAGNTSQLCIFVRESENALLTRVASPESGTIGSSAGTAGKTGGVILLLTFKEGAQYMVGSGTWAVAAK